MRKTLLNNRLPRQLLLVLLPALMLTACSPARKIIRQPLREEGAGHVFDLLKKNELKFEWLTARFTATMEVDKNEVTIGGQVRIRRDSTIWISLVPGLGIEVARILITQDSVKFLNRIANTYLLSDFTFINDNLNSGFDFDMLQSLSLGNDLSYYENDKFRANVDNDHYRLSTIGRHKLRKYLRNSAEGLKVLVQSIWVDPDNGKISKMHVKELGKENKKLETGYGDFQALPDGQLFPAKISCNIEAEKKIRLVIDFSRIRINEPASQPFSIPGNYSRITQK